MSAAATLKAALSYNRITVGELASLPKVEALRLPLVGPKVLAEAKRQTSKRGGARKGSGVKPADGATDLLQVGVRIRRDQKRKLSRLGGSVWVRRAIDEAE